MATERDRQLQEIVILLTKRAEADTPLKKSFADHKLQQYPDDLIREATEQMEGMGGMPIIPTPESMAEAEDFVLLWQEQLLSLRSEMKAVIETQGLFSEGLKGLAEKAPDLIGQLPMQLQPDLDKNASDAQDALQDLQTREKALADLRAELKEWRAGQAVGTSKGGIELERRSGELKELAETLLPDLARRMKAADDRAVEIQSDIVVQVTEAAQDVASRLHMASEQGYGGTYDTIKKGAEKVADGLSWCLSYFTAGLVPTSQVTLLKVAVNTVVDTVKELHIGLGSAWDTSELDEALGGLSPYATYLANMQKTKDWVALGFDLSETVKVAPYVGEWLWNGFEYVKGILENVIDSEIKYVTKLDGEISKALEEIQNKGKPTPEEIKKLKKQWLSARGRLEIIWEELKDKVAKIREEWQEHALDGLKTLFENGLYEGAKQLYEKAVEAVQSTISDLIFKVFPRDLPDAVFGFEISEVVQSLVVNTDADFTEAEKNELAALSA